MAKDPIQDYLAQIGRKGGQAKVPKGLAMLSPAERSEAARKAVNARWAGHVAKRPASSRKPAAKKGKAK